jgi:hypothetical protein
MGTPKIWRLAATPANSAMTLPRLARISAIDIQKVTRTPKLSRMRSESPLPVTTPMRALISCTTTRAMVMGMRVQSRS